MHSHRLSLLLLFTTLQAAACTAVSIVGGKEVKKPMPWLVSIQVHKQGQHFHVCGGILIHQQWVLTAAHCKAAWKPTPHRAASFTGFLDTDKSVTVLLGALTLKNSKDTQRIGVQTYAIPQGFNEKSKTNDIMLLKLKNKVQLKGKNVKVSPLPKSARDVQAGTKCEVYGWGSTSSAVDVPSDVLREVEVTVVSRDLCNCEYNKNPEITQDMLCAGNKQGNKDACQGDSGGPLVCQKHIVGLVSGGNGCGDPKKPGVYTLLSKKHLFWIKTILKQSNSTDV